MFRGRLASTPPPIISGVHALVIFLTYVTPRDEVLPPPIFLVVLYAGLVALTLLWCLDLYLLSTAVRGGKPSPWSVSVYWTAIVGAAVILPLSLLRPTDERLAVAAMLPIVLWLVVMGKTSATLVAAEADENRTGILLTFFQIAYLIIGVWYLCPRAERLLARRDASSNGA